MAQAKNVITAIAAMIVAGESSGSLTVDVVFGATIVPDAAPATQPSIQNFHKGAI
jgi:hypothetical protein